MRLGSSTLPGFVYDAKFTGIGPPGRNVPTGATAETPGILAAISRPSRNAICPFPVPAHRTWNAGTAIMLTNTIRVETRLVTSPPLLVDGASDDSDYDVLDGEIACMDEFGPPHSETYSS